MNDDSSVVNKLETSLTDDARVVMYNCHMFIVHATGDLKWASLSEVTTSCCYDNFIHFH